MQGSILVFGGSRKARQELVRNVLKEEMETSTVENVADIHTIGPPKGKKSIGINQVREAIQFLQTKPFALNKKAVVIWEAEKLTIPSQNSLLKTLEETPEYALILLEAKTENSLLGTVISRCRKINIKGVELDSDASLLAVIHPIDVVLEMDLGERLALVAEIHKEEREDILDLLEMWVIQARQKLTTANVKNIELIMELADDLEKTNVNIRLGLENLVLHLE